MRWTPDPGVIGPGRPEIERRVSRDGVAPSRTAKTAEDRFTFLTNEELGARLRMAAYETNTTISDVVAYCLAACLDEYRRKHRRTRIERLRPGKRLKLPR